MRWILYIGLVGLCNIVHGQTNLVPNYSFEVLDSCPDNGGQFYVTSAWFPVTVACEIYSSCDIGTVSTPSNSSGFQFARTGINYAGIGLGGGGTYFTGNIREYVGIRLTDTLIAGKSYQVTFYCNFSNIAVYAVDRIGAYLSPDSLYGSFPGLLPYTSQINNPEGNVLRDTVEWVEISGIYTATGDELYLTIGNFYPDSLTNVDSISTGGSWRYAYYYIDDVSVIACDDGITCYGINTFELWLPNIFSPNGDGTNDELLVFGQGIEQLDLYVYNRWGEQLYEGHDPAIGWDGTHNGSPAPPGVYMYYAVATYANGETETKYGNVTLVR